MLKVDSFRNVFALGDCCVTPVVEEKGVVAINQLGRVVWRNLVNKHDAERLITVPPRTELLQGNREVLRFNRFFSVQSIWLVLVRCLYFKDMFTLFWTLSHQLQVKLATSEITLEN